ncbi:hypothetical protein BH10PSE18_BH10PSE18_36750 [soil metagenome]
MKESSFSEGNIEPRLEKKEFNSTIHYSVIMQGRDSNRSYWSVEFENVRIEALLKKLRALFFDLHQGKLPSTTPTSVKITYKGNDIHRVLKSLGAER